MVSLVMSGRAVGGMSPCSFWRKLLSLGSRKFCDHLAVCGIVASSLTFVMWCVCARLGLYDPEFEDLDRDRSNRDKIETGSGQTPGISQSRKGPSVDCSPAWLDGHGARAGRL